MLARLALVLFTLVAVAGCSDTSPGAPPDTSAWPEVGSSSCEPVYYEGEGRPQLLIASDLPMLGVDGLHARQMAQAVKFTLKHEFGFRSGRFRVGYQVCDDSPPAGEGWSESRCAANAAAYARTDELVGLIGPLDSGCARVQLPTLNRAAGGPLAAVSPTATAVGLTRGGPATARGEPERYAPTGTRGFVRLAPADDVQAGAAVELFGRLDVDRVALVRGPGSYAAAVAGAFRTKAARRGLELAAASGTGAVFLVGDAATGAEAVRSLRAQLGPEAILVLSDGFADVPRLVASAGEAAEGAYLLSGVQPAESLGPAGREFVERFRRTIGHEPGSYAVYAAQAANVLLGAVARSDGSRRSVTAELFETEVSRGLLGSFAIDSNGDRVGPFVFAVYRIADGRPERWGVVTVDG